jgi:hypothetical protein
LTQNGAFAPVANVLQNTIGTITWSRSDDGVYAATSAGLFTLNKTFYWTKQCFGNPFANSNTEVFPDYEELGEDVLFILNVDMTQPNAAGKRFLDGIDKALIEIKVYN